MGFFFAGTLDATAQWAVDVNYDTINCNCGTILERTIEWELTDLFIPVMIDYGDDDPTGENPFPVSGSDPIYDAGDRYLFAARVSFYDSNGRCCTGWSSDIYNGDEIVSSANAQLYIEME